MLVRPADLSLVLVVADEPQAEERFGALRAFFPNAVRLEGVSGYWQAVRRAAQLATTERFVTVEADTEVHPAFAEHALDDAEVESDCVLAWPNRNAVNGLCYSHSAIRCWPRAAVLEQDGRGAPVMPKARSFGTCHPDGTPARAFVAAFREAGRLGLVAGRPFAMAKDAVSLSPANAERLAAWTSLGADAPNGPWCVYGARLACRMLQLEGLEPARLDDGAWLEALWREQVAPAFAGVGRCCPYTGYGWDPDRLAGETLRLGAALRARLPLDVVELDPAASRFMKTLMADAVDPAPFDAAGNLYRDGSGVAQDLAKAALCYRIGAALGSSNALNNLARLHREGLGVAQDEAEAARLLALATDLGNPYAPYHLAKMRLGGRGGPRDPEAAAALLALAAERGFAPARAELAKLRPED